MVEIVIASDHGGFRLKRELCELLAHTEHHVTDLGTADGLAGSDYPDFAHAVAANIASRTAALGILVCGTGIGMAIAANRHSGVRAVVCSDTYSAKLSRAHNACNILCLGERVVGTGLAWEIVTSWLAERPSGDERHVRRRAKIEL